MTKEGAPSLRAVGLLAESYGDETTQTGTLTWTGSDWAVTGDAGWLLTDYSAGLPSAAAVREVSPHEGQTYLYAVWYSMVATYFGVRLFDADGRLLDRDEMLAEIETIKRAST